MISDIGGQVADIARTQGELNALKAAQDKYGPVPEGATEKERQAYLAKLRDTPEYKKEQEKSGTGSDIQRGIQAATAALQGLAGGNIAGALAGASAPELAHLLKKPTEDNAAVNAIAHAILGGVTAALQGNSAAAGAAGAASGELIARAIAGIYYPGVKMSDLTEDQKQTISSLASISAGIAGGIAGGNTASAATGAAAGKNAVENNGFSYGDLIPPRVQQDASLAIVQSQNGKNAEEVASAIDASHVGPSWGTEYKVKPNGKVEVSGGAGFAMKGGAEINNDYFSISSGYTKEIGIKAGASLGVDFGPYFPGIFGDLNRDYSGSVSLGPGGVGMSAGKDGFGFSFSVGPSIGFTGSSTGNQGDKLELNRDSTKEIYHHDFK